MNIQVTASHSDFKNVFNSHSRSSMLRVAPPDVFFLRTEALKLTINGAPIYQRKILPNSYLSSHYQPCKPVCLFGGKGRPKNDDEASPWKSIEKGMGNLKKEQSVEDALRKQIEKQEYYGDGGSGGGGDGGGGGGGGRGGDGGSGDGGGFLGFLDELVQVILAAAGLIFVYAYLIVGEDWPLIGRDYIKLLFGARMSYRVRRNNEWWVNFYNAKIKEKLPKQGLLDMRMPMPRIASLESKIANTETSWDKPVIYGTIMPPKDTQLVMPRELVNKSKKYKDEDDDEYGPEVVLSRMRFDDSDKEEVDDKPEPQPESEPEPEADYREISYDDSDKEADDEYSGTDEEIGDDDEYSIASDEEVELEDSFEFYLVEGSEIKEDEDFLSILDRIDMSKAERLANESSDSEGEEAGGGKMKEYEKVIDKYFDSEDDLNDL